MNQFRFPISVKQHHIDELQHVNNVSFLQFVQDAAEAHWLSLTTAEMRQDYVWMVLRHEIDYLRQAFLGDTLEANTWVVTADGVRSIRVVEIMRSATGEVCARAKTTWCLLDSNTKKPKRIDDVIKGLFGISS